MGLADRVVRCGQVCRPIYRRILEVFGLARLSHVLGRHSESRSVAWLEDIDRVDELASLHILDQSATYLVTVKVELSHLVCNALLDLGGYLLAG